MDFFTFIDSITTISPYFTDMATAGMLNRKTPLSQLLPQLRQRGVQAEEEMLKATCGVNTHKGAIFSLGIICVACGYVGLSNANTDTILHAAGKIAAPALKDDFSKIELENAATKGEEAYIKYNINGIRGEAASGFTSVSSYGLPTLKKALNKGATLENAGVETLLRLISCVEDTNIIGRSSPSTLKEIQTNINVFFMSCPSTQEIIKYASLLDLQFIKNNISPGGCADLLAVTYMLHFIEAESKWLVTLTT